MSTKSPTVALGAYGKDFLTGDYFAILHIDGKRYKYYTNFQTLHRVIGLCKFSGLRALNAIKRNCNDFERLEDDSI